LKVAKQVDIQKLVELVETLRSINGCPWDREQTRETLKPMLIEEAYEVLEALDNEDSSELKEELGDLLFQVVFHAQIANERNEFHLGDVIDRLHEKMIRRHPHIFGDADMQTPQDILKNWEDIKAAERGVKSTLSPESEKSLLDGIPQNLPALYKANQMTAKASRVGFDWPDLEGILAKIDEETDELRMAHASMDTQAMADEVGDLLFVAVNAARFIGIDPDSALRRSNRKFERRFRYVESRIKKQGRRMQDATLREMDVLWQEAKENEG
jgi:tetrapyrrole methylase family protein / MazG family protein